MRRLVTTALIAGVLTIGAMAPAAGSPGGSSTMPLRVTFDASGLGGIDSGGRMTSTWLVPYPGHPALANSSVVMPVLMKTVVNGAPTPVPDPQGTTARWQLKRGADNYAATMVCVEANGSTSCTALAFHIGPGNPAANDWHVSAPLCAQPTDWRTIQKVAGKWATPIVSLGQGLGITVVEKSASELRVAAVPLRPGDPIPVTCN